MATRGLAPFQNAMIGRLPSLVDAMVRARPECRAAYLNVLRRFQLPEIPEEVAGELIRALIASLRSRDREVRCQVAGMLGEFGGDARQAIPALLAVVDAPGGPGMPGPGNEGFSRFQDPAIAAAEALRRVAGGESRVRTPSAAEVVAALIRLMEDPAAGRRLSAVYALTSFEMDDAVAGAFIVASRDQDEWVRVAGLQALQARGARLRSRSLETIREALEDRSPRVRYAAAFALIDFGVGVEPMVPALIRHAEHDPDLTVRNTVARALGSLGPPAVSQAVVPMYLEAIEPPGSDRGAAGEPRRSPERIRAAGPRRRSRDRAHRCARPRSNSGRRLPSAGRRSSEWAGLDRPRRSSVALRRNAARAFQRPGRRARRRPATPSRP